MVPIRRYPPGRSQEDHFRIMCVREERDRVKRENIATMPENCGVDDDDDDISFDSTPVAAVAASSVRGALVLGVEVAVEGSHEDGEEVVDDDSSSGSNFNISTYWNVCRSVGNTFFLARSSIVCEKSIPVIAKPA